MNTSPSRRSGRSVLNGLLLTLFLGATTTAFGQFSSPPAGARQPAYPQPPMRTIPVTVERWTLDSSLDMKASPLGKKGMKHPFGDRVWIAVLSPEESQSLFQEQVQTAEQGGMSQVNVKLDQFVPIDGWKQSEEFVGPRHLSAMPMLLESDVWATRLTLVHKVKAESGGGFSLSPEGRTVVVPGRMVSASEPVELSVPMGKGVALLETAEDGTKSRLTMLTPRWTPKRTSRIGEVKAAREPNAETLHLTLRPGERLPVVSSTPLTLMDGFTNSSVECSVVRSRGTQQVLLHAKAPGFSYGELRGTDGTTYHVAVTVSLDAKPVQTVLDELFPDLDLQVIPVRNSLLVRGTVKTAQQTVDVREVVEQFNPSVLNHLRVGKTPGPAYPEPLGPTRAPVISKPVPGSSPLPPKPDDEWKPIEIPRGYRVVTLKVRSAASPSLKNGDRIDLLWLAEPDRPGTTTQVKVLLSNAQVFAVEANRSNAPFASRSSSQSGRQVSLLVKANEVSLALLAEAKGNLVAIRRGAEETSMVPGATLEELSRLRDAGTPTPAPSPFVPSTTPRRTPTSDPLVSPDLPPRATNSFTPVNPKAKSPELRQEVKELREDVNRLIEILEKRAAQQRERNQTVEPIPFAKPIPFDRRPSDRKPKADLPPRKPTPVSKPRPAPKPKASALNNPFGPFVPSKKSS